jgi:hypothetical protein
MSMTEEDGVWDCRFCIAAGGRRIWNARKDGGNSHANRKQLTQSWLIHQGICKNRKAADFAKRSSCSTFSTSVKRRAFEFMDTCVDDQGWFDRDRAKVYLMDKNPVPTKSSASSNEEGQQEGIQEEGDLKQEEREGVPKRRKGDDNDIYENFVCNTI